MFDVLHLMRPERSGIDAEDPRHGSRSRRDDLRQGSRRLGWMGLLHRERREPSQGHSRRSVASAVSLSHDGRVEGVLRTARVLRRHASPGAGDAIRQLPVRAQRSTARVCCNPPICTIWMSGVPSGPNRPPTQTSHAIPFLPSGLTMSVLGDRVLWIRPPAEAKIRPKHPCVSRLASRLDGERQLVDVQKIPDRCERTRPGDQRRIGSDRPRQKQLGSCRRRLTRHFRRSIRRAIEDVPVGQRPPPRRPRERRDSRYVRGHGATPFSRMSARSL